MALTAMRMKAKVAARFSKNVKIVYIRKKTINFYDNCMVMRNRILLFLLLVTGPFVYGSDSLQVNLNTHTFIKGDTLEFKCIIPNFVELKLASATLNVWIEDVERTHRWKFRYPMINGEVAGSLAVSDKIPDGRYAVNFLVQRGFFKITGEVVDHEKKDTTLNYIMVPKNKKGSYFDNAHVGADGHFRLKSILFADSAYFIFSPTRKTKNNTLLIKIETQLDSAFSPVLYASNFITVGDTKMLVSKKTDTSHYIFTPEVLSDINILPNVTVTGIYKKKIEQYDQQYSSGLFRKSDAIIFDGLENDDIAHSINVLMFLQSRVPGLTITKNEEGLDVIKWRNEIVEIYIDEFRLDASDHTFVSPTEIAMIKVYRPPAQLSAFSGSAGAISIYTKKGGFADNSKSRHNFIVKGYTNIDSVWE